MGEVVVQIVKWTIRIGFISAILVAGIFLVNIVTSLIFVSLNYTALADIFAIIQLWLPFNLNTVLVWLVTASTAYLTYRLAILTYQFVNSLVGEN